MKTFCNNYENPNRAGPVKKIRPEPGPARIRPGPVDTFTVYVYVYIVYVYVVLTRVYGIMHRDVLIYAREPGNEVNTTATLAYYRTFIVAILLDMTSQMLYRTLPFASIVSN